MIKKTNSAVNSNEKLSKLDSGNNTTNCSEYKLTQMFTYYFFNKKWPRGIAMYFIFYNTFLSQRFDMVKRVVRQLINNQ